ncbi:MAG TPA: N-acetylmuramoyl-L-alanine amidase [Propionibacteriaceae bacterium]|nr:N-acetylmuramoyl-L-alanine amidase [Propionibacteriaceae bacterium]
MPDYATVTADYTRLMTKHFTKGRGASKIRFITRHHNAGISTTDQTWQTWQRREASAHYQIEVSGRVGQLVYDADTAWANGDFAANASAIAIEHSNCGGAEQDWPIADATIVAGAKWAAALCVFYKLGRPEYGKNIRDHKHFYGTGCPWHLAADHEGRPGKYHARWMQVAQDHYDSMTRGTPTVSTPNLLQEIWDQLRGPNGKGWPQLGGRTIVDSLAEVHAKLDTLIKGMGK